MVFSKVVLENLPLVSTSVMHTVCLKINGCTKINGSFVQEFAPTKITRYIIILYNNYNYNRPLLKSKTYF